MTGRTGTALRTGPDPDFAARTSMLCAIGWLAITVVAGVALQIATISSGLAYGPIRAVHDNALMLGWLTTAGFAIVFAIVPRVANVQLHNEVLGAASAVWWTILLFAGMACVLLGINQGRSFAEFPAGVDAGASIVLLFTAYNVTVTLVRRRVRTLYVSAWYLTAAVAWVLIIYVAGNLAVLGGVLDAMIGGFYVNGLHVLWLLPVTLGAAYYVIPATTGNPLHSRQIATMGFWSLAVAGGWLGVRTLAWGPAPDYLEVVASAMAVVLLLPVLSALSNLSSTARGRWSLIADDYGLRFTITGLGLLVAWAVLQAIGSMRAVSATLGLTSWEAGLGHLVRYGAFTAIIFGAISFFFPRMMGRAWYSRRLSSFHFWGTIIGAVSGAALLLGQGLVQAAASSAYAASHHPVADAAAQITRSVRGFQLFGALAYLVFAVSQVAFIANAYLTNRKGDPLLIMPGAAA